MIPSISGEGMFPVLLPDMVGRGGGTRRVGRVVDRAYKFESDGREPLRMEDAR